MAVGADDVGKHGLLHRHDHAGAEAGNGTDEQQDGVAAHEADDAGEQAVDGQADEQQRAAPHAVGQAPGELQRHDVADGEGGQRETGDGRAMLERRRGEQRDDGHADAEVGPAVREGGHEHGAVGVVGPGVAEAHDRGGALRDLLPQGLGVEAHGDDDGGQHQRAAVDEERHAHAPGGHRGAEDGAEHVAQKER